MRARKEPTKVVHFTHLEHLPTILDAGLMADSLAQTAGVIGVEIGNHDIKGARRRRPVPNGDGGSVDDYVPFYFGPRSPMMYSIAKGNVDTYNGGTDPLIYLVTTLERLVRCGHRPLLTDRNAALATAAYREFDLSDPLDDSFIAWDVMDARYWDDHRSGKERRMAECLVHERVGVGALSAIVAKSDTVAGHVRSILEGAGVEMEVRVIPSWYF